MLSLWTENRTATVLLELILFSCDFFNAFLYTFVVRFHTLLKCVIIVNAFLPCDALLSAVYAVVVFLSVCLIVCVCLSHSVIVRKRRIMQLMPHDRPGTLVFKWDVL